MTILLKIGEPWNFIGPYGNNRLLVESITEGSGKYGDFLLCSCRAFNYGGVHISSIMLSGRQKRQFIIELEALKIVTLNVYWRANSEDWTTEAVISAEKDKNIIGGFFIASGEMIEPE